MRRRRLWWIVGAVPVVAVAGIAWVAISVPTVPLHFWVRDGDDAMRLHRTPDGEELPLWTAKRVYGLLGVERQATFGDRVRSLVGLSKRPLAAAGFEMSDDASPSRAWREFIVIRTDDGWLPVGTPDPALVGHWSSSGPFSTAMNLRADGRVERGPSDGTWGRSDDLVVIDTHLVGSAPSGKPTETFVLGADRRTMRDVLGRVWRKAE